ncbi:M20 family peptidase [Ktedonosporobacter rubrisoli]|uniref:M20 family peptidase n=1 Tax=Ktedonosporobacter rubrisoli TaxID=2509675 RepID=A0A4P6JIM1_KTERU|nr:M20/M25/M40 family metallo-hydrolase [Ktedonosporobacter rubrisoli]QBD74924.1 M20 family peptidase [Ktedonosporobacter rubrisoli]
MQARSIFSHIIDEHFESEVTFLQQLIHARSANIYTAETSPVDIPLEAEVADAISQKMHSFGWQPRLLGLSKQRPNVLYIRPGKVEGKTLILNTHMDTVPASKGYMHDPWDAQIENGKLYGLGAADAKAQIAAFIYALRALDLAGIELAGTLKLAFVVDEETGANSPYGTRYLLEQGLLDGDAALIGEPGDSKIALGHRGIFRFHIRIRGEAVHTGLKEWEEGTRGSNAILDMSCLIQALSACTFPHRPSPAFPGRKNVLTFPTLITGGRGINIVPETCDAYGDIRLLPGLAAEEIRATIEQCLAPLEIPYELQEIVFVPAVETPHNADIVKTLARSVDEISGTSPRLEGAGPACDGWMFSMRGIETICGYGVRCGGVHGADEWADLDSLRRVTEIYALTILRYLGQA